jgi:hypothetical protein
MPEYEVTVHRTLFVSLGVEADSKEEAEALAKERIETEFEDTYNWNDYDPLSIDYEVMDLTALQNKTQA